MDPRIYSAFANEMEKRALIERLVRLAATDIPKTPRILMRKRDPAELQALQSGVENLGKRFVEKPLMNVAEHGLKHMPPGRVQNVTRKGVSLMAKDPVGLAVWGAVPVPGSMEAYYGGKKLVEKGLDKAFPIVGK